MPTPTQLTVDLDAIHANLTAARELGGGRAVLAAVKADAYGHGLVPVARAIEARGSAEWLGVALTAEAEAVRAAGVRLPILKFTPTLPDDLPAALAADVTISVGDPDAIAATEAAAAAAGRVATVHLKVDTGMRRVGVSPAEAIDLVRQLADSPHLSVGGIFTHLPVSDTPSGVEFTRHQFERFGETLSVAEEIVGPIAWAHVANSGAILGHELGRTNLVRAGIMTYGSYPDPQTPRTKPLREVQRWTSRVLFVKRIAEGESVGYGRTWVAPRDTWIATVAVGYGDGYSRLLSSRGRMLIRGRSYPIAGRVCMDQTMLDLGPEDPVVRVGDEVVLLGRDGDQHIPIGELAELMGTITYEVSCLITARVPRLYVEMPG